MRAIPVAVLFSVSNTQQSNMHHAKERLVPLTWMHNPFVNSVQQHCNHCGVGSNGGFVLTCSCGVHYCGESCKASSSSHACLCVGPHEESHPTYQLKVLSLQQGCPNSYATIQLACQLLFDGASIDNASSKDPQQARHGLDETGISENLQKLTFDLVEAILALNEHDPITFGQWSNLLETVNTTKVTGTLTSLHSQSCKDLTRNGDWDSAEANHLLLLADCTTIELTDEPDQYFPPSHWYAVLQESPLSHSCIPTHIVTTENGLVNSLQLEAIPPSREGCSDDDDIDDFVRTISRIDSTGDYEERSELLLQIGITHCQCVRCRFERLVVGAKETDRFSLVDHESLLSLAKEQERFDDAMILIESMIRLDPHSDHLLQRIRIAGWQGDYARRENLLALSHNAPEMQCPAILALRTELQAYHKEAVGCGVTIGTLFESIEGLEGEAFSLEGVLDEEECAMMIEMANDHVGSDKWTTQRHYTVPTTDIPVYQIPELVSWFNTQLGNRIFPILRAQFGLPVGSGALRIFDAFLVKYDAFAGQCRLPLHNDNSHISLTIAMNPCTEYEGGGTYFADIQETHQTDAGGMISFRGDLVHAGTAITKGIRFIIVCFIYIENE